MFGNQLTEVFRRSETFSITRWIVNGTCPSDWAAVAHLAKTHEGVIPQFGVHPWNAEGVDTDWEYRLREMLVRFPKGGVGEIGLDRKLTPVPIGLQMEQCRSQLELALELNRCCTLHVVGAWQELEELLKDPLPDRWLLHSFGGSPEQAEQYAAKGAFFTLGGATLRQSEETLRRLLEAIPFGQLMLETDAPFQHPEGKDRMQEPAGLLRIAERIANLKDISVERLRAQTEDNLSRYLRPS